MWENTSGFVSGFVVVSLWFRARFRASPMRLLCWSYTGLAGASGTINTCCAIGRLLKDDSDPTMFKFSREKLRCSFLSYCIIAAACYVMLFESLLRVVPRICNMDPIIMTRLLSRMYFRDRSTIVLVMLHHVSHHGWWP